MILILINRDENLQLQKAVAFYTILAILWMKVNVYHLLCGGI